MADRSASPYAKRKRGRLQRNLVPAAFYPLIFFISPMPLAGTPAPVSRRRGSVPRIAWPRPSPWVPGAAAPALTCVPPNRKTFARGNPIPIRRV